MAAVEGVARPRNAISVLAFSSGSRSAWPAVASSVVTYTWSQQITPPSTPATAERYE
jgi:hypothetical protein